MKKFNEKGFKVNFLVGGDFSNKYFCENLWFFNFFVINCIKTILLMLLKTSTDFKVQIQ